MQVQGFSAAAVAAGIRYPNRLDLGLIFSQVPAVTAGAFTTNAVKAAPLQLDMERLRSGLAQAVVVNSGNANACTGAAGMATARAVSALAADALTLEESLIQVASTGVIGQSMPLEPFSRSMAPLVGRLSPQGFTELARAMMTTDTYPKIASTRMLIDGVEVSVLGVAKGSGMIMPDMATMLCFVVTDACIDFPTLDHLVKSGVEQTFNRITVDGDTSTNDMVLVMANGLAGHALIDARTPEALHQFGAALHKVFRELALMIVADGEGATKMVTIRVTGAENEQQAVAAARTIANSALVKTAFFGEDANWGRIIAALGRSKCAFDPDRVAISFDSVLLVANGQAVGGDAEAAATAVMQQQQFTVTVQLQRGRAEAEVYTCDLSFDYVKINADYRS
ncbi:bifunctional glutamate N-acetyltransferase/amino-acid acetyltransferase ArgJ [Desulfobulbus alkaliphilus]|uniref:bifunctional glutamate N-acetyltransferase/amino-acid acetyltransferase ArgJ n=1 Tax=Desulfobulbus alkaliphilus TaxID=869814 RepID=UPI00196496C4|nr:bifunctional glutamate N-acetyltransferase/amino-acid acetyltransferase ArgJ [Desulfobulbus alkaliphilus]MBM9535487.1 bifunctional glutamate N-acetyltransferase/amino-acid acetyltransferase ArgJ [Desulfobulbus alkaliphilus]